MSQMQQQRAPTPPLSPFAGLSQNFAPPATRRVLTVGGGRGDNNRQAWDEVTTFQRQAVVFEGGTVNVTGGGSGSVAGSGGITGSGGGSNVYAIGSGGGGMFPSSVELKRAKSASTTTARRREGRKGMVERVAIWGRNAQQQQSQQHGGSAGWGNYGWR
eukprot:GABV01008979.1.p1 GENE.GABV01008979.1~~GABV01008979.1.p1  ORF type:complete len:159 (+),score=48.86 GABV01008979.1:171-647(+)